MDGTRNEGIFARELAWMDVMTKRAPTKREILDQLHITTLRNLVRGARLEGVDKRRRVDMTAALVRARGVKLAHLRETLEAAGDVAPRSQAPRQAETRDADAEVVTNRAATGPVFVAIDFETADRGRDSACAVGLVRVEGTRIVKREVFLIRPPRQHFEFTYIHGITYSMVRNSPTFGELWPKLAEWLRDIDFLVAHNASFDRSVLQACCDYHELEMPPVNFECTMRLARRQWEIYPTKLPDVCRRLGIELNHHEALSDAAAAAGIVIRAVRDGYRP